LLEAIAKLPIPKVMSYQLQADCELPGWTSVSFVRPAHGLVALHGADVVPVKALGLQAGRDTHGHRFEAAHRPGAAARCRCQLCRQPAADGAVIASFAERRAEIAASSRRLRPKVGGGVRAIDDDALLDEVTALVERPNVLVCSFEKEFLGVPQECLILTMKANQKYFPLLDAAGKLTHQFLVVSNISPADASAVIGGNERVVRPRLADAKFFFDQDRKKTLESRVEAWARWSITTSSARRANACARAGHRAQHRRAAGRGDEGRPQADQAARLAKTDLVTDMVGEFPELQGTMGRYYALTTACPRWPMPSKTTTSRASPATLPRGTVGVVVALADKLETLAGMFGIGNLPTGDRDPFALRRHALGVIRMLNEQDLALDLDARWSTPPRSIRRQAAGVDRKALHGELPSSTTAWPAACASRATAPRKSTPCWPCMPQRLAEVPKRLAAVRAFAALPEAEALAAANKRIANILKKAGEVDPHVSELLLQEPAEKALHAAMAEVAPPANASSPPATTPPRCRRWPRCARRSMRSSTA
jgi:glycyl-tRNA synthetase beta chain